MLLVLLWLTAAVLTALFFFRLAKVIRIFEEKYPHIYRKADNHFPLSRDAFLIFRLRGLLDDGVSREDRRYLMRTEYIVAFATLIGVTFVIVAVSY
jgi:hypothetical protein